MERPRIKFQLTTMDWTLEILGFGCLITLIVYPIIYFNELPEIIPRHFSMLGKPNGFGNKSNIWLMPVITTIVFISLTFAQRFPHRLNYLFDITHENAERQYKNAILMLRVMKTMIAIEFLYMSYSTIQISLGHISERGILHAPIFLFVILGSVVAFAYRNAKLK